MLTAPLVVLVTLLAADQAGRPPPNHDEAQKALRGLADQIQKAILATDAKGLVAVVAEGGLSCIDSHEAKPKVLADLLANTGSTYEVLFDTARLRARVASWGPPAPPPELISFLDYFRKHPQAHLVIRGDSLYGALQWQLDPNAIDMHSPRFEYRWDGAGGRFVIISIGCN